MRGFKQHLILFSLGLALTSPVILGQDNNQASRDQQRADTEKELQLLRKRIKDLQTSQAQSRSKLTTEQQALKKADIAINRSNQNLRKTRQSLATSQNKLKQLGREKVQLNQAKSGQQKALAEQIRTAYMNGKQEYIKVLLNQEDPAKLARVLAYYDYLNKARAEKIASLKQTLTKLAEVIEAIAVEEKELAALETTQKQATNELLGLKKDREKVVNRLKRQVVSNDKKLQEWQDNEVDLVSILDALEQQIAQIIPQQALSGLSNLKGQLNWPVNGRLKERYGKRREGSQVRWSGVLIGASSGQSVQAIHHGRVVYSDYLRGFGLMTIIDHGDGYMSLYGHNEALYKTAGDWVEAGERIAIVGQTGGYPSTGLYFEIRHKSQAVNPLGFIRRG